MVGAFLAKLRLASRLVKGAGGRPDRVSILLPFLIISIGLGVLAYRSYYLSVKMEESAKTLAGQYAGYTAEITARRVDAAAYAKIAQASEELQQMERRLGEPTFATLREWVLQYDWLVSAAYVPDLDPASSVFVSESPTPGDRPVQVSGEFFTSEGSVKYTYDAVRLLGAVHSAVKQQPLAGGSRLKRPADVVLVRDVKLEGLSKIDNGFAFVARLGPPMQAFGIRAEVRSEYVGGSGWSSHRLLSLWVSLLALGLTGFGAFLAMRGVRKEAETAKLRGALIANVSHELRTPLSMIRLGAETLKRGKLKPHERDQIEDQILREVLLLSHLVENVLDVARIQNKQEKALAFTAIQPRELVRNLISTYDSWIRSKGFAVNLEFDETIEDQMWDRDSVSRALLNLIDNAIKYSADEKTIDVVLRQTPEHVIIEVRDRGIGIEGGDVSHIFEPYFRAKFSDTITRRGAGLGLTLVRQIVEAHGGHAECDSVPGQGSTFRLLFPAALTASASAEVVQMPRAREAI